MKTYTEVGVNDVDWKSLPMMSDDELRAIGWVITDEDVTQNFHVRIMIGPTNSTK